MTRMQKFTKAVHPAAEMYAEEFKAGKLSRREFITRASALGVGTAAIYALGGITPAEAQDTMTPQTGGTLRVQMETKALKDPRNYDWSQMANFSRGWLEYLVEYQRDGSIKGMLFKTWEANEDATEYTLHVPQGVV